MPGYSHVPTSGAHSTLLAASSRPPQGALILTTRPSEPPLLFREEQSMCHERSINCVLNIFALAPSRQLNTTNCRATATFLPLTLLISLLDCHQCADAQRRCDYLPTGCQQMCLTMRQDRSRREPVRFSSASAQFAAAKFCRDGCQKSGE